MMMIFFPNSRRWAGHCGVREQDESRTRAGEILGYQDGNASSSLYWYQSRSCVVFENELLSLLEALVDLGLSRCRDLGLGELELLRCWDNDVLVLLGVSWKSLL